MGMLSFIFRRKSVYSLRKAYDRLREKADRESDINKKIAVLRSLDQIEPTLVALEEQILSGFERRRMTNYVGDGLKRTKKMLKDAEYFSNMMQPARGEKR